MAVKAIYALWAWQMLDRASLRDTPSEDRASLMRDALSSIRG